MTLRKIPTDFGCICSFLEQTGSVSLDLHSNTNLIKNKGCLKLGSLKKNSSSQQEDDTEIPCFTRLKAEQTKAIRM